MGEIESYYHFAEECRKLAATMKDPKRKKQLEEMADAWTFVANERATSRLSSAGQRAAMSTQQKSRLSLQLAGNPGRIVARRDAGATPMPYSTPLLARQLEHGRLNRFLATLPPHDFSLLAPHLRTITLERGAMLHDVGEETEHVYLPHSGMVSMVAVMKSGATVETATIGRSGVIGASAGLGARSTIARAVVQLPGTAAVISAWQFRAAVGQSQVLRDLTVRYNDFLLAQAQQSVACNALHTVETRLCRWLLQTCDCTDGNIIPLTQEFLGQMLGVRRTTVTVAAHLLQSAGLIRYRRGHIQILDRPALEDISCECYAVVRQNADKVFEFGESRSMLTGGSANSLSATGACDGGAADDGHHISTTRRKLRPSPAGART